jgi:hypothetical protein
MYLGPMLTTSAVILAGLSMLGLSMVFLAGFSWLLSRSDRSTWAGITWREIAVAALLQTAAVGLIAYMVVR